MCTCVNMCIPQITCPNTSVLYKEQRNPNYSGEKLYKYQSFHNFWPLVVSPPLMCMDVEHLLPTCSICHRLTPLNGGDSGGSEMTVLGWTQVGRGPWTLPRVLKHGANPVDRKIHREKVDEVASTIITACWCIMRIICIIISSSWCRAGGPLVCCGVCCGEVPGGMQAVQSYPVWEETCYSGPHVCLVLVYGMDDSTTSWLE